MFRTRYRLLYILLLGIYSFLNLKFTEGDSLLDFEVNDYLLSGFILLFVVCIWEGNRLLAIITERLSFLRVPYGELITHFLTSILFILVLSFLGNYLAHFSAQAGDSNFRLILGFNFRINLFLHCINAIFFYRNKMEEMRIQAERFKKQKAEAQFDALSKQLNPHFLFNSFNVLSTLVDQDPGTAQKFINRLSGVYRYLLRNQDNKLVKLKDEMKFLEAYIYLMKTRFRDSLVINNDVSTEDSNKYIAPSTLQLLIENAIKHNEVSKISPLSIDIYQSKGHLVVENTIKLKEQEVESSYVGLANIKNRYAFLSEENPLIIHSNGKFTVKIPLIEVEER